MLVVDDLSVSYGMHEALVSVSLQVARDEIVVILGANGAGKSTLLSAVAGNCVGEVDGTITLDGKHLAGLDAAQIVELGIAYVPEGRGVFADLSVEENLHLGSYVEHARRVEQQTLRDVLALFPKLEERKKQIVRTMSGGEQQMVAIGRALMSAPSILMLDEPSLGLSPLLCKELFGSLQQVRDSGVGILLVEQNAKQSLGISDRGYLLGNGKMIGNNSAQQLLNDPAVQSAYLGGSAPSQASRPNVTVIADLIDKAEVTEQTSEPIPVTITPLSNRVNSPTVSSDSFLAEDISALVARANSSATESRVADTALPKQVVKLTSVQSDTTTSNMNKLAATGSTSLHSVPSTVPGTQDAEVQAMLDEFESAALNAANSASSVSQESKFAVNPDPDSSHRIDQELPLPHIPVYKKSSITVFRRDDNGVLRKQD